MCAILPIRLRHLSRQILATSQVCHHSHHKTCLSFQFGNLRHVSRIVGGDMSFICQHYNQWVARKDPIGTSVKPLVLQTCFFQRGGLEAASRSPPSTTTWVRDLWGSATTHDATAGAMGAGAWSLKQSNRQTGVYKHTAPQNQIQTQISCSIIFRIALMFELFWVYLGFRVYAGLVWGLPRVGLGLISFFFWWFL